MFGNCFKLSREFRPPRGSVVERAAYQEMPDGNGEIVRQAVGPCCAKCYSRAIDMFGFDNYLKYVEVLETDEGLQKAVEDINKNERLSGSSIDWQPHGAQAAMEVEVAISRSFTGITEQTLRNRLGVTRVTGNIVSSLHEVVGPCLCGSGHEAEPTTTYFLFKKGDNPPDPDAYDAKLSGKAMC